MPDGFKRVRDKYGERYDVPEELAMDPDTQKSWILGERQRRGFGGFNRNMDIPEPDVMSNFSRGALELGSNVGSALNPLPFFKTFKDDWDEGRYVGHTALHGLLSAPQKPFEEAYNRWNKGDFVGAGAKAAYGSIPLIGPMMSEAGDQFEEGNYLGGTGSSIGIGLGTFGPLGLKSKSVGSFLERGNPNASAIIREGLDIPDRSMAISDPSAMPIKYGPGEFPVEYGPDSPVQGTYVPRGTSASSVQERFPRLMEEMMKDEHIVERPPAGTWPERFDRLGNAAAAKQKRRFAEHEARTAEALQDPSTNANVFGALAPERVTEPFTPYPQNQFGLLPEALREPSADANFGVRPNPRHYGLRPSGEAEALAGMADPDAPRTSIHLQNASPDNIARMKEQGYTVLEEFPDGSASMRYDPEGKFAAPRKVESNLMEDTPEKVAQSVLDEVKKDPNPESQKAAEYSAERMAQIKTPGFMERQKTKFSNARDFMREFLTESDEAALDRFGEAGKSLRLGAQQATADSYHFSGQQIAAFDKALEQVPKAKRKAFLDEAIDHIERGTKSSNPAIQNIIESYRAADVEGNKLYVDAKLKVKNLKGETVDYAPRENYWHHQYPEGFAKGNEQSILAEMVKEGLTLNEAKTALRESKKQSYGFLDALHQRRGNLPGYSKEADVARGHWIDMSRKSYNEKVFGQLSDENSFVRQKIEQIREQFGDDAATKAEEIMSRYMGKDVYHGKYEQFANMATGFEAFSKLGASILRNVPGGMAMTAARAEVIPYVKALGQSFTKEGRHAAKEMGVLGSLFRDAGKDVGYGSKVGKAYGINAAEKYLRTFSGLAGKNEAMTLFNRAKKNPNARTLGQLQDLILEPDIQSVLRQTELTENQIARAANRMVDLTQGRADSMNLPHAWSSPNPTANILTQFKKYAFIQTRNMKTALKANPKMVIRLAPFMALWGEGSADLRALISGKERPEGMARLIDNMSSAFGLGLASDIFTAATQDSGGEAMARIAPAALGDLAKVTVAGTKSVGSMWNDSGEFMPGESDFSPLKEEVAGMLPIFGGRWKRAMREAKQ